MLIKKPIAKLNAKETRLGLETKKKTVKANKKSRAASYVLRLMDTDFTYQKALKAVSSMLQLSATQYKKLVKELDTYI